MTPLPQRILIVNVNWLGDVVLSTVAIRALRERYPTAHLASLVVPRCAELLRMSPDLNEVIVFDEGGAHRGWAGFWRMVHELRPRRFDGAILLHRSFTRTWLCWLAGIRQRIGYWTWKRGWLLTTAFPQPRGPVHRAEMFLRLVDAFEKKGQALFRTEKGPGPFSGSAAYGVRVSTEAKRAAEAHLGQAGLGNGDRFVVLHPGSNRLEKRWPVERYAELAERILAAWPGRLVVTGSEHDRALGARVAQGRSRVGDLCGRLPLGELAAVLGQAALVVTNDTGPMHLAVSQGAPVIALFGPTRPQFTGPYGPGGHVVIQRGRHMDAISVDEVWQCAKQFLSRA